jgi:hypothetical protein
MSMAVCKLAGKSGPFVKSHIIPQSLTSPDPSDQSFAPHGAIGNKPPITLMKPDDAPSPSP